MLKCLIQLFQLGDRLCLHVFVKLKPQGADVYTENMTLPLIEDKFPRKLSSHEGNNKCGIPHFLWQIYLNSAQQYRCVSGFKGSYWIQETIFPTRSEMEQVPLGSCAFHPFRFYDQTG